MPIANYPFVDIKGVPKPGLPVILTNPANDFSYGTWALIDTGADNTVIPEFIAKKLYHDPKSLFQEKAQESVGVTPTYEVLKEWGPDHNKHFVVGAYLAAELVAEGEGPSKQEAQEQAAAAALQIKKWE